MRATHTIIDSPLGDLTLVAHDGVLAGLYFAEHARRPDPALLGGCVDSGFEPVVEQLGEYFRGDRTRFDLPFSRRGDGFQQRVWALLDRIPYGQTRTYGQLAAELGNPGLAREVGGANGRNPLSIIVPCHRVLGADGGLVGYAGGLDRKRALLQLEGAAVARQMSLEGLT